MKRDCALPLLAAVVFLVAGCSTPERVVLLPQADGRPSAVIVRGTDPASSALVLAQPYAQAVTDGSRLQLAQTDAAAVRRDFGALMDFQPARPRRFVVNFRASSNELTAETAPVLDEVRRSLADLPAGEAVVTGHTDSVGAMAANDTLSLSRARMVADLLVQLGVPHDKIQTVGRGEREPLVPTSDETDEPRNRRVEIKLR